MLGCLLETGFFIGIWCCSIPFPSVLCHTIPTPSPSVRLQHRLYLLVCLDISRGPFLQRPGNLPGPESDFDIKVSRKVGRVLTSDEVYFVSLADNFTVEFSNLLKLPLEWKTKQLNGPGNYRELRETDLR